VAREVFAPALTRQDAQQQVQTAWRLVNRTRRWSFLYNRLKVRTGAKKAIVAIARRVWCVMFAMLKSGQEYRLATPQ